MVKSFRPLYTKLPQMSGHVSSFKGTKYCLKLEKFNKMEAKISIIIEKAFDTNWILKEKYLKTDIKIFFQQRGTHSKC